MMDRVVDMTIKIVNERTVVEVFSYNKMKNIFNCIVLVILISLIGCSTQEIPSVLPDSSDAPEEKSSFLNMDIKTFNIKDNTLILNVEE